LETTLEHSSVSFEGQLTEAEFSRIQWHSTPRWLVSLPWLILGSLVVVLLTGDLSAIVTDPLDQLPRLFIALGLAAILFIAPRRAIRKAWASNANVQAAFSGLLSDEGIEWRGAKVQGHFQWSDLYGYRAAPDFVIIYTSSNQAVWLFPRFFAKPEDWQVAVGLVTTHLKKR